MLEELRTAGYDRAMVFTQYTDTMDFLRDQLSRNSSVRACGAIVVEAPVVLEPEPEPEPDEDPLPLDEPAPLPPVDPSTESTAVIR